MPQKGQNHREECFQLLSEVEDMWDRDLRNISTAEQQIKLTSKDILPVNRDLICAGPTARHFDVEEIQKLLQEEVIRLTNTE